LNTRYSFVFEDKRIDALLHANNWPITIIDHSNELYLDEKKAKLKNPLFDFSGVVPQVLTNHEEILNVTEFINNSFREFYPSPCTAIIINFECYDAKSNFDFALEAFKYFFKAYQIISEDVFALSPDEVFTVTNTYFKYFYCFSISELALKQEDRYNLVLDKNFEGYHGEVSAYRLKKRFIPDYNIANDKRLQLYLNSSTKDDFILEAMTNAHRQMTLYKNYKYALLDCFFVIEYVVFKFVENKKIERGLSKNKLKDFSNRIGISYLLNIEMPLLLDTYDDIAKKIITELDQVRKVRNDIVHNAKNVTHKEALHAYKSVNDLLGFLKMKKF
jgi:hypothetical protein